MNKILVLFFVLLCMFQLHANEALVAYKKFKKTFQKEQHFSLKITKGMFRLEDQQILSKQTVQLYVHGKMYRQETEKERVIFDGATRLSLNTSIRTMVIQQQAKKGSKRYDTAFLHGMDSLLAWSKTVKCESDDDLIKYHLTYKEGPFERISIAFRKKDGFFQSIAYFPVNLYPKESEKAFFIRVTFSDIVFKPKIRDAFYSISPFVRYDTKLGFLPIGIYSNFKVLQ